ncbi:hypothetical protein KIN20_003545 [Parelaphostrongylus tenuis]|uniref:Uncharacterized protein n=1 Tax=Parelaphostrongylus tenuis TaxID=148309 RepID=A0AAD5QIN8_PARTN|nr:hypothetical protein KIN20_003545 [Parelaphostrongylus tenuis]
MNRLRFLTRGPKPLLSKTTATTMATEEVEYVEEEEADEELATTTRRRRINEKKRTTRPKIAATTTPVTMTTKRRKIWTRSTVSRNPKNSSKSLPIWRRLLSTTTRPSPESIEIVTEESVETNPEDEEDQVDVNMELSIETTTQGVTSTECHFHTCRPIDETEQQTTEMIQTFRPMPVIVPMPGVPEVAIQKPSEKDQAIWKRFQPDRWFESIRHITNTGK